VRRHRRRILADFALASVTILAIVGTLSSCGRYGSPVRVAPAAETTAEPLEEEVSSSDTGTKVGVEESEKSKPQ
jgi:predicted small lipoprotein YifL